MHVAQARGSVTDLIGLNKCKRTDCAIGVCVVSGKQEFQAAAIATAHLKRSVEGPRVQLGAQGQTLKAKNSGSNFQILRSAQDVPGADLQFTTNAD